MVSVPSQAWYAGFLALLAVERGVEWVISRRNAQRAFARGALEIGQAHFRVMSALHTAFFVACAAEVFGLHRGFPGALGWAALGIAVAAQALRYWAITTLGLRWNVRIIFVPGEPPVTSGPYRFLRHPNYLAVVAELFAVPLIHGAYLTATVFTLLNAALLTVRIRAEERALGEPYELAFRRRT